VAPASLRSTLSEIEPASAPVRSSGTARVAHENAALLAHGANSRLEAAEELGQLANSSAGSSAARA
jgi:hypothetical protein